MQTITTNTHLLKWVDEIASLTTPAEIVWIDGSEAQLEELRQKACETGELIKLNQKKLPGCYYHRSNPNDVARVENRTFICCNDKKDAGPTNNWMDPKEAYALVKEICKGCMKGETMYIIPYCMGPIDSPFSKIGFEITDSIYVVLNMAIMSRTGKEVLRMLGNSRDFVKGVHCKCDINEEKRYIMHFPQDNTIWTCNSAYGGNVLLGKKCFALRIASYMGRNENWMAEHMLILGIQKPNGETKYVAAAFPSACGKTNLAMLIPPEGYRAKGYKLFTVGDDIAWLRVGSDGQLYAINPEAGFFGVAPGTGRNSNPNAVKTTHKDSIFTNVALNPKDNTVWWEGLTKVAPDHLIDWLGHDWDRHTATTKAAHPNSRFTAPTSNCPCISPEWENKNGVPISAIIFGGRRAKTAPLVYESRSWEHGVFIGSVMASETTAAAAGKVGVIRRDPMAMLPFCGYNMADYFRHWLDMGEHISKKPKIFNVNWFRTDDEGHFIWPGYGENFRVLDWIIKRCEGTIDADESAIGYLPHPDDINLEGLDISRETLQSLLSVDKPLWLEDVKSIEEFYAKFDNLPKELRKQLDILEENLK